MLQWSSLLVLAGFSAGSDRTDLVGAGEVTSLALVCGFVCTHSCVCRWFCVHMCVDMLDENLGHKPQESACLSRSPALGLQAWTTPPGFCFLKCVS